MIPQFSSTADARENARQLVADGQVRPHGRYRQAAAQVREEVYRLIPTPRARFIRAAICAALGVDEDGRPSGQPDRGTSRMQDAQDLM